jgi:hypothetical protein
VITDACWALSYMADGDNSRIEQVVQADGICNRLVQLLTHKSTNVITPALRAVGNIVTGTDSQTEVMMHSHLDIKGTGTGTGTCDNKGHGNRRGNGNGSGGDKPTSVSQLFENNNITPVVSLHEALERLLTSKTTPTSIIKECCWTISNLTAGPYASCFSYLAPLIVPSFLLLCGCFFLFSFA